MEIRFPGLNAPHYLSEIAFSFADEMVNIEILDGKNCQRALFTIERTEFVNSMRALGISTRPVE